MISKTNTTGAQYGDIDFNPFKLRAQEGQVADLYEFRVSQATQWDPVSKNQQYHRARENAQQLHCSSRWLSLIPSTHTGQLRTALTAASGSFYILSWFVQTPFPPIYTYFKIEQNKNLEYIP